MEKDTNKDLILREKLAIQRTILANQTTLLAFVRTSMYFLVAGLSIDNFIEFNNILIIPYLFYVVSFVIAVLGVVNYFIQKNKIKKSEIHVGNYKLEVKSEV